MTQFSRFCSAVCHFSALLGVATLLMAAGLSRANQDGGQPEGDARRGEPSYLFVCAGDQARKNPDFLAVVNFDEDSSNYGKVIAQAPLPEPGAAGNEFHHIGLSADGKVAACGGLLRSSKGRRRSFSGTSPTLSHQNSFPLLIPLFPRLPMNSMPCPRAASWSP